MNLLKILILLLGFLIINPASAMKNEPPEAGKEKVKSLLKISLPDMPGHTAMMVIVDFLPGQGALPHRHPGSVFAYVLEGRITSQLEGQNPMTYHKGEFWYEPPLVGHLMCKNASNTKPAKILVWQLIRDKDPIILPYKSDH